MRKITIDNLLEEKVSFGKREFYDIQYQDCHSEPNIIGVLICLVPAQLCLGEFHYINTTTAPRKASRVLPERVKLL